MKNKNKCFEEITEINEEADKKRKECVLKHYRYYISKFILTRDEWDKMRESYKKTKKILTPSYLSDNQ